MYIKHQKQCLQWISQFHEEKIQWEKSWSQATANTAWLMSRKCNIKTTQHCLFYCQGWRKRWKNKTKILYITSLIRTGASCQDVVPVYVTQHSCLLQKPPKPPWYGKEKGKKWNFGKNLGACFPLKQSNGPFSLLNAGFCLYPQHAKAALMGGNRSSSVCVYTCTCRHLHTFLHPSVNRCTFASLFHYASCFSGTFEFWCLCVHSHLCVKQGQATGWHGTIDRGSENGSSVAVVIGVLDIVICCAWSCHYSGGVCHYECMYTSYMCATCVCRISCPTIHIRHAP